MATCSKCIHFELCFDDNITQFDNGGAEQCTYFKDRSKFVELPCKVGETVYFVYSNENGYLIEEAVVTEVSTERIWILDRCYYFNYTDIGKTVFLTKEEAEKVLEEREQE